MAQNGEMMDRANGAKPGNAVSITRDGVTLEGVVRTVLEKPTYSMLEVKWDIGWCFWVMSSEVTILRG